VTLIKAAFVFLLTIEISFSTSPFRGDACYALPLKPGKLAHFEAVDIPPNGTIVSLPGNSKGQIVHYRTNLLFTNRTFGLFQIS